MNVFVGKMPRRLQTGPVGGAQVLHELQAAMRTYHGYRASEEQARAKLELVEAQKRRLEASVGREKLERSRRFRVLTKELAKRAAKHRQSRLQGLKARNEYLLALGAANAAVHKYFAEDLSDLIDVSPSRFVRKVSFPCPPNSTGRVVNSPQISPTVLCQKKKKKTHQAALPHHRCRNKLGSQPEVKSAEVIS